MVFAITEPDAGSNTHQLSTTAARATATTGVLTGSKYYISGVDEADAVLVVARTGDATRAHRPRRGCRCSSCRRRARAGRAAARRSSAQLPERQFTLFFDDVRVGPAALVGGEGDGLHASSSPG